MLKSGTAVEPRGAGRCRLDRRLALRQSPHEIRLDDLARHDRREGGEAVRRHARGAGRVRARKPAAGRARRSATGFFSDEIVPVEVPRKGAAPLVVTRGRTPAARHCRSTRWPRCSPAFAADGTRDRRQFERDQRRRLRAAAGGGRHRHGRPAAGPRRRDGRGRRRSVGDGHRSDSRDPQGAEARRAHASIRSI